MKEFIIKILLFILPIILLSVPLDWYLSNFFSKCSSVSFVADEFSVWNDIYDKKIDADIAVYGSSRAYVHFNTPLITDSLGHEAYNFGVDGHNFWIQYLRHKEYLKNNRPPKVIILAVDYSTLQKRNDLYNYNQFLPYMLWNNDIMNYTSSYIGFQNQEFKIPLLRYMGEFNFFKNGIMLSLKNKNTLERRQKGFAGIDKKWNNDLIEAKNKNQSYKVVFDEETCKLFDRFLGECIDNDITVLMVYAPIYFEGLTYIENSAEVLDTLKFFAAKYKLDFLDYSKNEICYNKSYFYNSIHLNRTGADLFTNKLIQDLKNTNAQQRLKR